MATMVMCVFDGSTVRLLHHDGGDDEPVTLATFNVGHLTQEQTIHAAFELHDWYMRSSQSDPARTNGHGATNDNGTKRPRAARQSMLELQARTLSVLRMADEPMLAREITERLGLGADRKFAVYRLLKQFIADGLVERLDGYPHRYRAVTEVRRVL